MPPKDEQTETVPAEEKEPTYHVIREVYDNGNSYDEFETELDRALEAKVDYIIIEPMRLGDETGRWITVGNFLHKTAVTSGIASVVSGLIWQGRPAVWGPLCAISVLSTGLYTVCWNVDACCQYQVVKNPQNTLKIPLAGYSSSVVLGYSDNTKTKYFHRSITLISAAFCAWQIYKALK